MTLGLIARIEESVAQWPQPLPMAAMRQSAEDAAVPIEGGELTFQAQISVTWRLGDDFGRPPAAQNPVLKPFPCRIVNKLKRIAHKRRIKAGPKTGATACVLHTKMPMAFLSIIQACLLLRVRRFVRPPYRPEKHYMRSEFFGWPPPPAAPPSSKRDPLPE